MKTSYEHKKHHKQYLKNQLFGINTLETKYLLNL